MPKPLKGLWYDRSALDAKRRAWARKPAGSRGARPHLMDVARWKPVPRSVPPMWRGLAPAEVQARWRALLENAAELYPTKVPVLGARAVLEADPHGKPKRSKHSPAPKVHTRCPALRRMWLDGYRAFVAGYRAAMARLREGWSAVGFPAEGCRPACLLVERGG